MKFSIFFPLYKDEHTVRRMIEKSQLVASQISADWEIIVVDDGSPDRSGEIALEMAKTIPQLKVILHPKNLGYGAAVKTGLNVATGDFIAMTDGDDEYDVYDLLRMMDHKNSYDLMITFRYKKIYSSKRQFISYCYNALFRRVFSVQYRDISTGLRIIRRQVLSQIHLTSDSPFIGAEIVLKTMFLGYRVGEVGIQTFPREFGKGQSVSLKNILATIVDLLRVRREIFSDTYQLPPNRSRNR